MENKILVDTNVLLDYLLMRDPFYEDSYKIVTQCVDGSKRMYRSTFDF